MKKFFLALIACATTMLSASTSEQSPIKVKEPRDFTYVTSGSFAWASIPSGINMGMGKRWYGEDFAFGTSFNVSASLSVTPFIDILLEGLYFIDSKRYVGLQLGMGAGKGIIKNFKYQYPDGTEYNYHSPKWVFMPLVKFIPFGKEWSEDGRRQFMHFAFFPVGVSFNYGWEI